MNEKLFRVYCQDPDRWVTTVLARHAAEAAERARETTIDSPTGPLLVCLHGGTCRRAMDE